MTGKITVTSQYKVEWKVHNIFSSMVEDFINSPEFTLFNCKWYLQLYPNYEEGAEEWISMSLFLGPGKNSSLNQAATFTFGVKKRDGRIEARSASTSMIFNDGNDMPYGCEEFLKRSELVERKSELAPHDTLRITCYLRGYDDFDCAGCTNSLSNDFFSMLTSEKACDAILQVKQVQFRVHKFVLMARSPVFAAMFETPMQENATGVVHIEDCDPEAFRHFVKYLYSGRLKRLSRHVVELYIIADKYQVKDLKSDCLICLMGNLTVTNFFDVALFAKTFKELDLKAKTEDFFAKNCSEIFPRSEWLAFMNQEQNLAHELLISMGAILNSE